MRNRIVPFFLHCALVMTFFVGSICGAETLGDEVYLGHSGEKIDLAVEADDGDLHLAYKRGSNIYYKRQVNGIWNSNERWVQGSSSSTYHSRWYPHIAADSAGNAHFLWANPDITRVYYTSYTNNNWTALLQPIRDTSGDPDTNRCDIAVIPNDTVFVIAQSDFALEYNRKPFGGNFLANSVDIFYSNPDEPQFPSLGASTVSNKLVAVWEQNVWPDNGIMYSTYNGTNWGGASRPGGTGGPCCANYSNVAFDQNGRPHITWIVFTGTEASDLLYIYQMPSGMWSSITYLLAIPYYFHCPSDDCPTPRIAVSENGSVIIVIADGYNNTSKVKYFLKEADDLNFPTTPVNITTTPGSTYQNYPGLTVYGNTFHVVWSDNRGNDGLYYRTVEVENLPPALEPPILQQANQFEDKVYLNWIGPLDPNEILDYFEVLRRVDGSPFWVIIDTTSNQSYIDDNIWVGSDFHYAIRAVDIHNRKSGYSNILTVSIVAIPTLTWIGIVILLAGLGLCIVRPYRKGFRTSH